ncbi:glycosyltransferase [Agromyces sp. NPDC058110]|uniref:glycosyltransferase n=1 Tax=Agromyces sp. NPDC058110 TaxID=3346345 RepID=UPI0036DE0AC8
MPTLDVLFISGDIGGNVPPTIAIARELAARTHRVTIAGLAPRAGDAWADGIETVPIRALDGLDVTRPAGPTGHAPSLRRMALGREVGREVRALIAEHPADVVVVDGTMLGSIRESVRADRPTAALFHTFGAFWSRGLGNVAVNAALRPFGLAPRRLLGEVDALLLPTDPELDPAGGTSTGFAFDWLGITEAGSPPAPRSPDAPSLVLVSLSSAWQRGQGDVYRRLIAALGELADDPGVRAVVTTGGADVDGELAPPPNVEIRGRAPHAEIMPHADLVIGHGGHSTTMRALAHGLPILVLPLDPTSDQRMTGAVVERAGIGRALPRDAPVETLRDTIAAMLADSALRARAADTGERLRGQHGASHGADRVEAIAGAR